MRLTILKILTICFFIMLPVLSIAQLTKIRGVVMDETTNEPIPFANVFFKNTTIGVSAGFDGEFTFEVDTPSDTLAASSLGYKTSYLPIKKGVFQEIAFHLRPTEVSLNEVEIFAEVNPVKIKFCETDLRKCINLGILRPNRKMRRLTFFK